MSTTDWESLPELGVGIVHVPGLERMLGPDLDTVDLLEIEPQTRWRQRPGSPPSFHAPADELERLVARSLPILVHGVGDPVGGTRPASPEFMAAFCENVERLRPHWVSEHLAFNRVAVAGGERHTGFFLPPAQTSKGVELAALRLRTLADAVGRPVLFETGVSYLRPRSWELPDGDFFAEVARAADAGILLDLHNLYTNARNGRQSVEATINVLPLERVVELHLAGGLEHRGYWLDAHCGPTPPDVRRLAEAIVPRLPNLKAIVFETIPYLLESLGEAALREELGWVRELWGRRGSAVERTARSRPSRPSRSVRSRETPAPSPGGWEVSLSAAIAGNPEDVLARDLAHDPGVPLYRELIDRFRAGSIAASLPWTIRALRRIEGAEATNRLLRAYLRASEPQPFEAIEALGFARALTTQTGVDPAVRDTVVLERAGIEAELYEDQRLVVVEHEPKSLFAALARGHRPRPVGAMEVEILGRAPLVTPS